MTAEEIIEQLKSTGELSFDKFYELINDFQLQFLRQENYEERKGLHRNPIEVKSEILRKLGDLDLAIQNREWMRDNNVEKREVNYVPFLVKETWRSDKRLKSLYSAVKRYCEVRKKDFITIAVHMAEYRAVNRLILRIRRDIRLGNQHSGGASDVSHFTFNDWLEKRFYNYKDQSGIVAANDSEKYEGLVKAGFLPMEELAKIHEAQQKAYDYIVECSVRIKRLEFETKMKDAADVDLMIETEKKRINKFNIEHQEIWKKIIDNKKYRHIKYGAKFLLPEHYKAIEEKNAVDVFLADAGSAFQIISDQNNVQLPSAQQMLYVTCEFNKHWLRLLKGYGEKAMFEKMVAVNDFKMLIERYGDGHTLKESYLQRLEFAANREWFINEEIKTYESVIPRYQGSIICWDQEFEREVKVDTGQYKRRGYGWVIKGYNPPKKDLILMIRENASIPAGIPVESTYGIYILELKELALGGAIAYYVGFLKEELAKPVTVKKKKPVAAELWRGTESQREKLFEQLAAHCFVENSEQVKANFMKDEMVHWLADGRSLIYLMRCLQGPLYNMIRPYDHLGPVIKNNFVNKNGEEFKNINQNLNGMRNDNKKGEPRSARKIDGLLKKVFDR